ncbi:NAD(P)/FAD-dependent oxidoreductase [Kibdelosporangium phytohabitans]|uniref:FAD-dependent oxidoreductase 2 FAD-binding domain-containing protein n=1 Tax=Kibdelosporangium phytohabitans TaxID=860235 RepID=A0A0N9I187_9PSEU|nr:FAD-binding protein [Kibdelosporangium phytohabitans]ALG08442.1 hypothetical protein AOZ06_17330 [Kibdelosporangium phytohabitans]MBE1470506.1 flavin-dependent dehydrogenase [Kibdelosporangium phytohabitans]
MTAAVIGASMAGLLAARVLSESHEKVFLLDRDDLPEAVVARQGVPQARHLHGLLARGRDVLEGLFPGLSEEFLAAGATRVDIQGDIQWTIDGRRMCRATSGLVGLSMSRALLEATVRARVRALPNVELLPRRVADGLIATAGRVHGVRVTELANGNAGNELTADLVVDASGRGSRSPAWLRELGYQCPPEDRVKIGIAYATRRFRRLPGHLSGRRGAVVNMSLDNPRGGGVSCEENDQWIVTLAGVLGDDPPLDPSGFADFAASLPDPRILEVIEHAEPIGDALRARFPASVRRRYERLTRFPEGYVVMGDAVCSFNPIYGQGMTVAAEQALVLRDCVQAGTDAVGRRFFRRTAKVLAVPWSMATSGDLRFGGVEGPRPLPVRLSNRYLRPLSIALEQDPAVGRALLRVANLIDRPQRIVAPDILFRVLRANLRRRRPAAT